MINSRLQRQPTIPCSRRAIRRISGLDPTAVSQATGQVLRPLTNKTPAMAMHSPSSSLRIARQLVHRKASKIVYKCDCVDISEVWYSSYSGQAVPGQAINVPQYGQQQAGHPPYASPSLQNQQLPPGGVQSYAPAHSPMPGHAPQQRRTS
jgi:hypothetical protein